MPKSAKKKKDKVADFSRAKLKLGKGKAPATNAIDTSFKARSIALPSQSITHEKDGSEPTTRRQLTFTDLTSHLKHYNSGTRKDAILGLRELFDANWALIDSSLTPLVNAMVRLIGDEDASVRKQLLSFLAWLLPRIPSEDLIPHSPLLLLFTTSAQTHIFPEIRIDAVRFLDILLECIPEGVTAGWCETNEGHGSRALGGYLGILNAGTKYGEIGGTMNATSTASVVLTPASKLVVLRSLSTFLRTALSSTDNTSSQKGKQPPSSNTALDAVFMRNAFPSLESYYSFESLIEPMSKRGDRKSISLNWQSRVESDDEFGDIFTQSFPLLQYSSNEPWTLEELSNIHDVLGGKKDTNDTQLTGVNFVAHLADTLHSTIIETYLDCAASVFSPSSTPSEIELQLVVTIARIAQSLYHVVLQTPENVDHKHIAHLEAIVNYMAPYFPASTRDGKLEQAYEEFNLIFCELTSLVVNASQSDTRTRRVGHKLKASSSSSSTSSQRVTQYISQRLCGEPISSGLMGFAIGPTAYRALLPTIWTVICSSGGSTDAGDANALLQATLDHALKVSSKSACKRLTVEFVARLMLLGLEPHYQGVLSMDGKNPDELQAKFDAWFLHLPQVLWELGGGSLPCTETILRVLLRVLQRRPKAVEAAASLQSRLAPYFQIERPNRGALPGPFGKLPSAGSRVRYLALDVAATALALGRQDGQEFDGLSRAVGAALAGAEAEQSYWNHACNMNKR